MQIDYNDQLYQETFDLMLLYGKPYFHSKYGKFLKTLFEKIGNDYYRCRRKHKLLEFFQKQSQEQANKRKQVFTRFV